MTLAFILLIVGLVLIFLEFYTPGGVLAVSGGAALLFAVAWFFYVSPSQVLSLLFVIVTIVLVCLVIWLALKRIQQSSSKNTFYLGKDQEGYVGVHFDTSLIGKTGIAISDFGPSGYVLVDGMKYQATANGLYLDKGTDVEVIGGEGGHLIVKPLKEGKGR
jgi:membrane-bound serine protease (ClpP class)